jgi:hypothetical protein
MPLEEITLIRVEDVLTPTKKSSMWSLPKSCLCYEFCGVVVLTLTIDYRLSYYPMSS